MIRNINILALALFISLPLSAQSIDDTESLDIISSVTARHIKKLNGVEIREGSIFAYGQDNAGNGKIVEYKWKRNDLHSTGYENGISLGTTIKQPTGMTYHDTLGTFLGNSNEIRNEIIFIDWDILKNSRNLGWATVNTTIDDLAKNTSKPEFVQYRGEWFLASVDMGDYSSTIRLYDPLELQSATYTSDYGVLRHAINAPRNIANIYWHNATGELLLAKKKIFGGWEVIGINLEKSVDSGSIVRSSIVGLSGGNKAIMGFHYLFGTDRAIIVTSDKKDNISAINLHSEINQ
jgi:hypothetical protein